MKIPSDFGPVLPVLCRFWVPVPPSNFSHETQCSYLFLFLEERCVYIYIYMGRCRPPPAHLHTQNTGPTFHPTLPNKPTNRKGPPLGRPPPPTTPPGTTSQASSSSGVFLTLRPSIILTCFLIPSSSGTQILRLLSCQLHFSSSSFPNQSLLTDASGPLYPTLPR
jgi:hypothetical protein